MKLERNAPLLQNGISSLKAPCWLQISDMEQSFEMGLLDEVATACSALTFMYVVLRLPSNAKRTHQVLRRLLVCIADSVNIPQRVIAVQLHVAPPWLDDGED